MFSSIGKLPRRQQQAIPILLRTHTARAAAKEIGVHEMTLFKWMREPDFQAAYRDGRYPIMEESFTILQKTCTDAVQTVVEIMNNEDNNPYVRLQAGQS